MTGFETKILRRSFLKGLGYVSGGLALGLFDWRRLAEDDALADRLASGALHPNAFVIVSPDGRVSLYCHRSEMGQGVRSSLPAILADELGAELADVTILQADADDAFGSQNTDGSTSVRMGIDWLRACGATARAMLVSAAAKRWDAPTEECDTAGGFAVHKPTGRKLAFGELAQEASALPVPDPKTVPLRPPSDWRYIGKEGLRHVDAPDVVRGKAIFAADVRLPGMLTAVVARPPMAGGKAKAFDAAAALAVPGVKKVLELPYPVAPCLFQPLGGVAVLATDTWAALRGRAALAVTWKAPARAGYDTARFRETLVASVRQPGNASRDLGNADEALEKADRRIEAEYFVPHLAHTPMEPPAAVAHFRDGRCEVWACTQSPKDAATTVAQALQIAPDAVTVHVTLLGGGFGRKSKPDYVAEAALLSRAAGAPVRVQWTRDDDIRNSYYHTISVQRLEAGLDASRKVVALRHRSAFPSIQSTFETGVTHPHVSELSQGVLDQPYAIENVRGEGCRAEAHTRIGWMRSVNSIHHAFAIGSFLDELAHARGLDPRDSLLELLGPARVISSSEELGVPLLPNYGDTLARHPIDVGRYRAVVEKVTASARWADRRAAGRSLGLSVHRSFLSYVAAVVSVTREAGGKVRVDEAWITADVGTYVNPDRLRAQLEGSVLFGMSLAIHGGVDFADGAVVQSGFQDYRLARMGEAPRAIHVDLVKSAGLPGGGGEPGVPPVAPALANAIFALTGKRLREIPFSKQLPFAP